LHAWGKSNYLGRADLPAWIAGLHTMCLRRFSRHRDRALHGSLFAGEHRQILVSPHPDPSPRQNDQRRNLGAFSKRAWRFARTPMRNGSPLLGAFWICGMAFVPVDWTLWGVRIGCDPLRQSAFVLSRGHIQPGYDWNGDVVSVAFVLLEYVGSKTAQRNLDRRTIVGAGVCGKKCVAAGGSDAVSLDSDLEAQGLPVPALAGHAIYCGGCVAGPLAVV